MGVSFAWLAAEMGYHCVIVMPNNMSIERKKTLEFYGAELIEVEAGDFDKAIQLRNDLCKGTDWFNCNQFHNELNIEAHHNTTAMEILNWAAENEKEISAIVTGTGTGGTLMGCHKRINPQFPNMKMDDINVLKQRKYEYMMHTNLLVSLPITMVNSIQ